MRRRCFAQRWGHGTVRGTSSKFQWLQYAEVVLKLDDDFERMRQTRSINHRRLHWSEIKKPFDGLKADDLSSLVSSEADVHQ